MRTLYVTPPLTRQPHRNNPTTEGITRPLSQHSQSRIQQTRPRIVRAARLAHAARESVVLPTVQYDGIQIAISAVQCWHYIIRAARRLLTVVVTRHAKRRVADSTTLALLCAPPAASREPRQRSSVSSPHAQCPPRLFTPQTPMRTLTWRVAAAVGTPICTHNSPPYPPSALWKQPT